MALLEQWFLSGTTPLSSFLCKICLIVDVDTFMPDASKQLAISFVVNFGFILTFLTTNRSSATVNFRLRPERGNDSVVNKVLYFWIVVCTDPRGMFNRLNMLPRDNPDL